MSETDIKDDRKSGGNQGHGSGGEGPGHGEGPGGGGHAHNVTIIVDDKPKSVRAGEWVVKDLKAAVGVDPAKVLAEITPHGLQDLADDAKIEVKEGQRFMSHARSGGSS